MSLGQYFPAGRNSNNPVQQLTSNSTNLLSQFPKYEISFKNPHVSYYSLNFVDILSEGKDYPFSTTAQVSSPEHPDGTTATLLTLKGLTNESLILTDGGKNHTVGDVYYFYNLNKDNDAAIVEVIEIDNDGAITEFSVMDPGSGFDNNGIYYTTTSKSINKPSENRAQFSLVQDKFSITDIAIVNGGSGYDYFDDDGIFKRRRITLSNSGSGYGFVGHITTEPILIGNEYKFAPKTHTSLPIINISNYSIQNSSSSSSLYTYYLTDCFSNQSYILENTSIELIKYRIYRLTLLDGYGGELSPTCYSIGDFDPEIYYTPIADIILSGDGDYELCSVCLDPPTNTPTSTALPTPTPTPYPLSSSSSSYNLSSSSSSSSSSYNSSSSSSSSVAQTDLCEDKDYNNYLFAALLAGTGGLLSGASIYKVLNKLVPQDPLEISLKNTDKFIQRVAGDLRATYRYLYFGEKSAAWFGHDTLRPALGAVNNTPRVWKDSFLWTEANNGKPIRQIRYASVVDVNGTSRWQTFDVPNIFDPSMPEAIFGKDIDGYPLELWGSVPDPRVAKEVIELTDKIHKHNLGVNIARNFESSLPQAVIDQINRTFPGPTVNINNIDPDIKYDMYVQYHLKETAKYWQSSDELKQFIRLSGKPGADRLLKEIDAQFSREYLAMKKANDAMMEGWGKAYAEYTFSNKQDGSYFFQKALHDQQYFEAVNSLNDTRDKLRYQIIDITNEVLRERRVPISRRLTKLVPPIPKLPKIPWFECKSAANSKTKLSTTPKRVPNTTGAAGRIIGIVDLIGLAFTGKATFDRFNDCATNWEAFHVVVDTIIRGSPIPTGEGEIQFKDPFEPWYRVERFSSRRAFKDFLNNQFQPFLSTLYGRYYLGEINKEECLNIIRLTIDKIPVLKNYLNLDLNLYSPTDPDSPTQNHPYYPFTLADATSTKAFFETIVDENAFDGIVEGTISEVADSITPVGDILYMIGLIGDETIRKVINKRRQERIFLSRDPAAVEQAMAPLVKAVEDYLSSLPIDDPANCDLFCDPQSGTNIANSLEVQNVSPNDPLVWVLLTPETDYNGKFKLSIQQLKLFLQNFVTTFYGR